MIEMAAEIDSREFDEWYARSLRESGVPEHADGEAILAALTRTEPVAQSA